MGKCVFLGIGDITKYVEVFQDKFLKDKKLLLYLLWISHIAKEVTPSIAYLRQYKIPGTFLIKTYQYIQESFAIIIIEFESSICQT